MGTIKTTATNASVQGFIEGIDDETKRNDSHALLELFSRITGEHPVMWGSSIVGFGSYHYKSERSKQEGDWPLTGFSPRKQALTIYIMDGFTDYDDLLKELGKYKTSVGCLYIKRLSDVNQVILAELISRSFTRMKRNNS